MPKQSHIDFVRSIHVDLSPKRNKTDDSATIAQELERKFDELFGALEECDDDDDDDGGW